MKTNTAQDQSPILVAGEPVSQLVRAFLEFETSERAGRYHIHADLEADLGAPLARALMRVEAELLRQDADAWGSDGYDDRTSSQRRADALVELVARCAAATGKPPQPPR
jgi:hypothetical protein